MAKGTVKFFNAEQGFGFISQADGPDVYVHFSGMQSGGYKALEVGQQIEFEVTHRPKGPQADQVVAIK